MTFRLIPLPYAPFADLFALDDAALAARRAVRAIATGGEPCRVTLAEATAGEDLLLVNHLHQPAATPYRARHAIYVRRDAVPARPAPGTVPPAIESRLLSLRAFDASGMMIAGEVVEGTAAAPMLDAMLADATVAEVHLHFARRGCFAARAIRA